MISDLSGDEARTSMDRFVEASTAVEAWFAGNGISVIVPGILRVRPDGQYCVSKVEGNGPQLAVNPTDLAACKYCDKASIPDFSPGVLTSITEFSSALLFKLKDGSVFTVF
jgi:hypothetical protein